MFTKAKVGTVDVLALAPLSILPDIFKSQLSDAEFRKHVDKVIDNGADIEKTRAQLEIMLGI